MCLFVCGERACLQKNECVCKTWFFASVLQFKSLEMNKYILINYDICIPHKQSKGYMGILFTIRPPVHLSLQSCTVYVIIFRWNIVRCTCILILAQYYSVRFKVTERKSEKFVFGPYLSFGVTLEVYTFDKYCTWPVSVSWFQPKIGENGHLIFEYCNS